MFKISANNGLCDVILGCERKTSDLAAYSTEETEGVLTDTVINFSD